MKRGKLMKTNFHTKNFREKLFYLVFNDHSPSKFFRRNFERKFCARKTTS